jgi:hypothetical protein
MNENREKIKELCEAAGSYSIAAKLIAAETQRRLSVDAIKSWTCNPRSTRARTCPDWAIQALEKKLQILSFPDNPNRSAHINQENMARKIVTLAEV